MALQIEMQVLWIIIVPIKCLSVLPDKGKVLEHGFEEWSRSNATLLFQSVTVLNVLRHAMMRKGLF
jgi:hypothetical protein